jgi:ABC-type antimicrobial peptide transport system permease subunit
MMIALNFTSNTNDITEDSARVSGSNINIMRYDKGYYDQYDRKEPYFTNDETKQLLQIINKYKLVTTNVSFASINYEERYFFPENNKSMTIEETMGSYNNIRTSTYVDYAFPLGIDGAITDGRIWNEDDVDTNHIWVKDIFIQRAFTDGIVLGVGSKIWFQTMIYDYTQSSGQSYEPEFYSHEYEIIGIISDSKVDEYQKNLNELYPNNYYFFNDVDIFLDFTYNLNIYPAEMKLNSISIAYFPPLTSYDFDQLFQYVEGFVDEVETTFPSYDEIVTVANSSLIMEFSITRTLTAVIIAFASALGLFILLLSIGSVANTIIISVDKNKKFIGLMKALGLKQRQVESVVRIEAIITISLGILISTGVLFVAFPFFESINRSLVGSIFSYQLEYIEYTIKTSIPVYLPFAVALVFIIMTLIFSRSSLRTIARMDVITIISEVS